MLPWSFWLRFQDWGYASWCMPYVWLHEPQVTKRISLLFFVKWCWYLGMLHSFQNQAVLALHGLINQIWGRDWPAGYGGLFGPLRIFQHMSKVKRAISILPSYVAIVSAITVLVVGTSKHRSIIKLYYVVEMWWDAQTFETSVFGASSEPRGYEKVTPACCVLPFGMNMFESILATKNPRVIHGLNRHTRITEWDAQTCFYCARLQHKTF